MVLVHRGRNGLFIFTSNHKVTSVFILLENIPQHIGCKWVAYKLQSIVCEVRVEWTLNDLDHLWKTMFVLSHSMGVLFMIKHFSVMIRAVTLIAYFSKLGYSWNWGFLITSSFLHTFQYSVHSVLYILLLTKGSRSVCTVLVERL